MFLLWVSLAPIAKKQKLEDLTAIINKSVQFSGPSMHEERDLEDGIIEATG